MRIISIDPSYTSCGIVLYDTDLKEFLVKKTIKFSSLSQLKEKEKALFINIEQNKENWYNIRLNVIHHFIKDLQSVYNYDVVLCEQQFSSVTSDIFAVCRLAPFSKSGSIAQFKCYYPNSWRKILFGKGNIGKKEVCKKITKEKVESYFQDIKFNSQDEIDCVAFICTFLKENDLLDKKEHFLI